VADTIELSLYDLAHGGDAVGRYGGQVVFVPLGLPGERVRVQVVHRGRRLIRARLVEILEASPVRVAAPCPFFGLCGGCHLQHLIYDEQLRHKRQVVENLLQRIGKQERARVLPTIGMPNPFGYRNNVQASITVDGRLGFQASGSNRVVPISRCLLLPPALDALWTGAAGRAAAQGGPEFERVTLRTAITSGDSMVILDGRSRRPPFMPVSGSAQWVYRAPSGPPQTLAGAGFLMETLAGRLLRISPNSFFQVNTAQAEILVDRVQHYLALTGSETLLDLYTGVGTFALTAGQSAARVICIESAREAVADALANRREGEPAEFRIGPVEGILPTLNVPYEAVILDPPRAGCAPVVLEALAAAAPRTLVYVSCDPATLARDVAFLSARGYALIEAQPVDMFPQTYHIETVALMERAE